MKYYDAKIQTNDAKNGENRRFRNILAASGKLLESGEVRDIKNMFVMGRDGKLIRIADLNKDPEKQTEDYKLNFGLNHGHNDPVTGERVMGIEDIIGDGKVWLDDDGIHARLYFANDDEKSDHAYAVSDNASYSCGAEWFLDGYYGADNNIDEPIGILREISMVETGNDPRAMTIDIKSGKVASGDAGTDEKQIKKGNNMPKSLDQLTPDEREAMGKELMGVLDRFTTRAPESQTEPTARDEEKSKDGAKEAQTETPKAETADNKPKTFDGYTAHMPTLVIRDPMDVHQEQGVSTADAYLKSDKAIAAWGQALLDSKGDARAWRDNFRRIAKKDGVNFGENVSIAPEALVKAVAEQIGNEDSILAHVTKTGLAYELVAIPTSEDDGMGHKNSEEKTEENVEGVTRVFTPADIYKLMKLDHSMVKINGGLTSSAIVKFVLRELPRKLVETIDRTILVGGLKNEDDSAFTAITSILTDITTANSIYGQTYTAQEGDNLRATITKAAARVTSGYERYLIAPSDFIVDLENATAGNGQLIFPNGIDKQNPRLNGIRRILTPLWLTKELMGGFDAIIVDLPAFHTVGDTSPENFSDYDIDYNKYVWEAVACIGGGLANKNAAVGIKLPAVTPSEPATPNQPETQSAKSTK